jgi:hypothetical protein
MRLSSECWLRGAHCVAAFCNCWRLRLFPSYMTIIESLSTYGIHYYDVTDKSGGAYLLGISCKGIGQYKTSDKRIPERVNFLWNFTSGIPIEPVQQFFSHRFFSGRIWEIYFFGIKNSALKSLKLVGNFIFLSQEIFFSKFFPKREKNTEKDQLFVKRNWKNWPKINPVLTLYSVINQSINRRRPFMSSHKFSRIIFFPNRNIRFDFFCF